MRAERWKRRLKIYIALIGMITVLTAVSWPHDRLLLNHATPMIRLGAETRYCWLTDQQILILSRNNAVHSSFHVTIHNLTTGTQGTCPALESLLNSSGASLGNESIPVSPDGKRLLWYGRVGSGKDYLYCADVNGRLISKTPSGNQTPVLSWLSDGRQWIEYKQAALFRSDYGIPDPAPLENLLLHTTSAPGRAVPLFPSTELRSGNFLVVVDQQMLIFRNEENDRNHILMDQYQIGPYVKRTQRFRLSSPRYAINLTGEYALSASGRHVCMAVVEIENTSSLVRLLRHLVPSLPAEYLGRNALFISSTKGIVLKDLGVTPAQDAWVVLENPLITQLAFSPDEKRISFVYKNTLYTVPAE